MTPHELSPLEHSMRRKPPPCPRHFSWLPEELVYPVFFVATGLSSDGDSLDRLSYLMEGAKVVISSRMQVMKHRGAASQEGVR